MQATSVAELVTNLLREAYPAEDLSAAPLTEQLARLAVWLVHNASVPEGLKLFSAYEFPPYTLVAPEHPRYMLNPQTAKRDWQMVKIAFPGQAVGLVLPLDTATGFFQALSEVGLITRAG